MTTKNQGNAALEEALFAHIRDIESFKQAQDILRKRRKSLIRKRKVVQYSALLFLFFWLTVLFFLGPFDHLGAFEISCISASICVVVAMMFLQISAYSSEIGFLFGVSHSMNMVYMSEANRESPTVTSQ